MQCFPAIWVCTGQPQNKDFQQEVKGKWKRKKKPKGNWCSGGLRWGFVLVFLFLKCVFVAQWHRCYSWKSTNCLCLLLIAALQLCLSDRNTYAIWCDEWARSGAALWGRAPAVALNSGAIIIWLILFLYLNDWRLAPISKWSWSSCWTKSSNLQVWHVPFVLNWSHIVLIPLPVARAPGDGGCQEHCFRCQDPSQTWSLEFVLKEW